MNFDDLKRMIHLAASQNIQVSAGKLNITTGALSKTLKKVEQQLHVQLFDRVGRNLQLNYHGEKFVSYASNLVHEYQQMCSEFTGHKIEQVAKISGPAVLVNHCLAKILPLFSKQGTEISINSSFEGQALKRLAKAQANIAIVTDEALADFSRENFESIPLGITTFKLAISPLHPQFQQWQNAQSLTLKDILEYPFACPASSPFCGVTRGLGSDGWADKQHPRRIAFRSDDYNALLMLIKQGHAIGYIPDFAIETNALHCIEVSDFTYHYQEPYSFVYKPSMAFGWLNGLAEQLKRESAAG